MLNQRGNWMKLMIQRWILGVFGCDQDLLWDGDSIQYSICLYGFVWKWGIPPVMSILNHLHDETHLQKPFFFCLGVRTHIWDHTMGVCNMNGQNGINNHVLVLPSSFYRHLFVHLVMIVGPFIEAFSCWLVDTPWSVHTLRSSISWNPVGTVNFVAAEVGICQRPCRRFWMNGRAGWSNVWKGCIVASRPLSLGLFAFFGDNLLPSLTRS